MATATFYTLSKRKNSTKQPTGSGTQLTVNLKSGTSLLSPTFLLSLSSKPAYNHVVFEGRNYFIIDIVSIRDNLWEIVCEVDAMATLKSDILNTKAYVLYDSVANSEIPDNRLPIKTAKTVSVSTAACPFVPDGGCYIVSITGARNSTGIYKMTLAELNALIEDVSTYQNNLFDFSALQPYEPVQPTPPTGTPSIEDLLDYIAGWLKYDGEWILYAIMCAVYPISQFFGSGNVPQNIKDCKFIPFNRGTTVPINNATGELSVGTFDTNQTPQQLNQYTVHDTVTVNIPWQTSDFRRRSPYTEIYLYLPYIGMVKLSSENLIGESTLTVKYVLGILDGSLIATVEAGGEILGQYSANVSANYPVGVSNINAPKAAQSVIAGALAVATKNISSFGMAAVNFADSVTPNFTSIGGLDGVAGVGTNQNITCYTVFHDTIVPPNTELATVGAPTMAPKALSGLTGFCQCLDAHVESSDMKSLIDIVDGYLNSGFFIE